ncbi:MAG: LysR family transcriptional regulator, partial [Cyclobacteriaceae bacterium]
MKYSTQFSFRIYAGKEPYLGPGRVQLMEGIRSHGSISRAAEEMGMSYRKAWQLVKDINEVSPKPLVEKRLGGKAGGG